eukprot:1194033-Amphidinium_carterae.1
MGDYAWLAKCTALCASIAMILMIAFGQTPRQVWWCLLVLASLRCTAVCIRAFTLLSRRASDAQGV